MSRDREGASHRDSEGRRACLHEDLDAVERRGDRLGDGARPGAGREERDAAGHERQQRQGVLPQLRHRRHPALLPGTLGQRLPLLLRLGDHGLPAVADGEGREGAGRRGAAPGAASRAEEESRRLRVRGRGRRAPGVARLHSPVGHWMVRRAEAGGWICEPAGIGGIWAGEEGDKGGREDGRVVKPRRGSVCLLLVVAVGNGRGTTSD